MRVNIAPKIIHEHAARTGELVHPLNVDSVLAYFDVVVPGIVLATCRASLPHKKKGCNFAKGRGQK